MAQLGPRRLLTGSSAGGRQLLVGTSRSSSSQCFPPKFAFVQQLHQRGQLYPDEQMSHDYKMNLHYWNLYQNNSSIQLGGNFNIATMGRARSFSTSTSSSGETSKTKPADSFVRTKSVWVKTKSSSNPAVAGEAAAAVSSPATTKKNEPFYRTRMKSEPFFLFQV